MLYNITVQASIQEEIWLKEKWVVNFQQEGKTVEDMLDQYIEDLKDRTFKAVDNLPHHLKKATIMSLHLSVFEAKAEVIDKLSRNCLSEIPFALPQNAEQYSNQILSDEKLANNPF